MTGQAIPREAVRRILAALVTAETLRTRGDTARGAAEDPHAWGDMCSLSVRSAPLDSLETVNAGAALFEMFDLGIALQDDAASPPATVGQWLDAIAWAQRHPDARVTVMTSGSTGRPRPCRHDPADLLGEADHLAQIMPAVRRIIALVPAHHIYGLIWTALLPARLGIPVVGASAAGLPKLAPGDLIVAVPDQWRALARSQYSWPEGVEGVSAGAPLDDALAEALCATGLARMLDVYGTSETGGVALRCAPRERYALLPRWRFASPPDAEIALVVDRYGEERALPDRLAIGDDGRFAVLTRRDGAVQVGGVNVWPDHVANVLRRCPGVAQSCVRLGDHHRLKAFVVPTASTDVTALRERLRLHAQRQLSPEQRPVSYALGSALPRTALGKLCDWP